MTNTQTPGKTSFDKTNAIIAFLVWLTSFVVYALTVQPTFSFWDCGEFIACSYTLGIPHPPGTPLFILIGRLFSIIPFVEDISQRINYISVITSAFTAMFSYMLTVRLVGYFFGDKKGERLNRFIAYIGGIAGGLFVAFSRTNWGNSVEAEVYGAALALSVLIIWLAIRFFDERGSAGASKMLVLLFYLAMLGVGIHMTVFLVVPIAALFFILKKEATSREYGIVSLFIIAELALIFVFSNGVGGKVAFYAVTFLLGVSMLVFLYRQINWAMLIAIGAISSVMLSFSVYMKVMPVVLIVMIILAIMSEKNGWNLDWRRAMAVMLIGLLGMSVHAFIPIRSALNPSIDENNPSRDWYTFVKYLDRKQYGQQSMTDRMFDRRGAWANQFGRHANMGFWSYFEDQYSKPGITFLPFLLLGLLGLYVAIRKRIEVGLPLLALLLVCSAGLILYMNFADGTKFNIRTGDAYLEVRNRDYFFTPAFVFFGIAMGMGVSALMKTIRDFLARSNPSMQQVGVYAASVLVLLPGFAFAHNYHACDRSENYLPYYYAANLLDSCEENAILFTSGDNDTFPLWCIQEVYKYRTDIRTVNLSLLNTDWYVYQMKNKFNVPIGLSDDQILWNPVEVQPGITLERPARPFRDRPRNRTTFLVAMPFDGKVVKVQDMMVDEIVLENRWKDPIYFSNAPYAESPLGLKDRATAVGVAYRLDREPMERLIDAKVGSELFLNTYHFDGYGDSKVYRDDNATGVFLSYGINAIRLWDEFERVGDTASKYAIADKIIRDYPEYWQMYFLRAADFDKLGDSAAADSLMFTLRDTLTAFLESNPENIFYMQDLGLTLVEIGSRSRSDDLKQQGLDLLWKGFMMNPNSNHAFRKLFTVLSNQRRYTEIQQAAVIHGQYLRNRSDPLLAQLLGRVPSTPAPPGPFEQSN